MWQQLVSFFTPAKHPISSVQVPPVAPEASTIAECQQLLLKKLKSGEFAMSSSDKEGYRVLCYYHGAFLYAEVGDEGTGLSRLHNDDILLDYVWRKNCYKFVEKEGNYQRSYDLTEAEKLERWQAVLTKLTSFSESGKQFVARILAEFSALERG